MREHQIVITLKPEHFLEVQRLAKVAGAKSMGIFVRQKLLSAFGMEGTQPPAPAAGSDVKRVTSDLRRLHGELKAFVSESLSRSYIETQESTSSVVDQSKTDETAPEPVEVNIFPSGESADPTVAGSIEESMSRFHQSPDELEQLAQRAFVISPRLGALEDMKESRSAESAPAQPRSAGHGSSARQRRDPLEDLLSDPEATQTKGQKTNPTRNKPEQTDQEQKQASTGQPGNNVDEGELDEADIDDDNDEIVEIPISIPSKSVKKSAGTEKPAKPATPQPPSQQPSSPSKGNQSGGMSDGPPPRRHQ